MSRLHKTTILALLALFLAAPGCADLDVTNENAPDRDLALTSAGDVESLVGGSFLNWWNGNSNQGSFFFLSAASFQHSPWPANFGAVEYSSIPRGEITNSLVDGFYGNVSWVWNQNYSALSAIRDGLSALEENPEFAEDIDLNQLTAFAKFVQGLSHASIAMVYDQGFVLDETTSEEGGEVLSSEELMQVAMDYLDEAISLSEGADFTIPAGWMSRSVEAETLALLAHSMKARYMAAVARTPAEREAVDWAAVLEELDAGLDGSFNMVLDNNYSYNDWSLDAIGYLSFSGWQQLNYFILGMADQSGDYQRWLDQPISNRIPNPGGEPVLIETADTRFPQGATLSEQVANPGSIWSVPDPNAPCVSAAFAREGNNFSQPARGTWRWSYYFDHTNAGCNFGQFLAVPGLEWGLITEDELRLLEAEAHLRMGDAGTAADLVNVTRTEHGLNATDAAGTNTSCVPRLPDETCGDLMEMLKWEKRIETRYHGPHNNGWYFDGRGWGDLYQGTYIELPVPEQDLLQLDLTVYTTGSGETAAPTSVYSWPGES